MSEANFYVPNLLPKRTPRKKKVVARSSSQATKGQKECHTADNEDKDEIQGMHGHHDWEKGFMVFIYNRNVSCCFAFKIVTPLSLCSIYTYFSI